MERVEIAVNKEYANIADYLKWRGDLTFQKAEFNEVDNAILSALIYVEFEGIIPDQGEVSLEDASDLYFQQNNEEDILARVSSTKMSAFLMRDMAQTKRFQKIKLSNYKNDISADEESQFCVMTVDLGDDFLTVVYSGTDETIVGWKENFNMSFLQSTPGQKKATAYLNEVAADNQKPIRIMGHSKGGNLSIYAAVHCDEAIAKRITDVYSNDGPGFPKQMLEQEEYKNTLKKIHSIVPDNSIVGMLLFHEEEYEIIKSFNKGAMQHDLLSWEVMGNELVRTTALDEKSLLLDQTVKSWVYHMEPTQREEFVNAMFAILEKAEIHTVDDLAKKMKATKIMELLKLSTHLDKESQEVLKDTIQRLFAESGQTIKDVWKKKGIPANPFAKRNSTKQK